MHETPEDLQALQALLDESRASMGEHMRGILTDDRWLTASELSALLVGVNVLALATVTASGEPRVGPVDGIFHRGHWYFGSGTESMRFRHIAARPAVSAVHTRGEELAVTVHGTAQRIDMSDHPGLRQQLVDTYGGEWEEWGDDAGAAYARIDARRMYVFHMPKET